MRGASTDTVWAGGGADSLTAGTGVDHFETVPSEHGRRRVTGHFTTDAHRFAFGMGVDRLAMLKYGMSDLREMFAADTRWLAHYGFSAFAAPNAATGLS